MTEEHEYFFNKKTGKTYISSSHVFKDEPGRKIRIARKVIDSPESHSFALVRGEHQIRVTEGGRQEIVAFFYEDDRSIPTLTVQRFTMETGVPHKSHLSFHGEEIPEFLDFVNSLRLVHFADDDRINVTDKELKEMLLTPHQIRTLMLNNPDTLMEIARSDITQADLVALGYRKKQLDRFHQLLTDHEYFASERAVVSRDEDVWQRFFEVNPWVFGYGLTFVHLSNLDDRKLEQVVAGPDLSGSGKRVDALMKTGGAIQALCFVEIKTHKTGLLQESSRPYRSGCWSPSVELVGGISQAQGTVDRALRTLQQKLEPTDADGTPTGEVLFTYQPKSFLVAGCMSEFVADSGVNADKYRSFELFRRNVQRPEIITFDELYDRARFIVEQAES